MGRCLRVQRPWVGQRSHEDCIERYLVALVSRMLDAPRVASKCLECLLHAWMNDGLVGVRKDEQVWDGWVVN